MSCSLAERTRPSNSGNRDDTIDSITVEGSYVYITTRGGRGHNSSIQFQVIDIRDPSNPLPIGKIPTAGNDEGLKKEIKVSGKYAYLTRESESDPTEIIDISDPTNPRLAGVHNTDGWSEDVDVYGDYAFIVAPEKIEVLYARDPTALKLVGYVRIQGIDASSVIEVYSDFLYVLDRSGLTIFDLSGLPQSARFDNIVIADNNEISLNLSKFGGGTVKIQRSTDLKTWSDWQTINLSDEPADVTDTNNGRHRFYRIIPE